MFSVYESIPESRVLFKESALIAAKSVKNEVEVEAIIASSISDAVALIDFFSHLEYDVANDENTYTELSASDLVSIFYCGTRIDCKVGLTVRTKH